MEPIDFEEAEIVRVGLRIPSSFENQEYYIFKSAAQIKEFISLIELRNWLEKSDEVRKKILMENIWRYM